VSFGLVWFGNDLPSDLVAAEAEVLNRILALTNRELVLLKLVARRLVTFSR
jgi:hypothetical protein